MAHGFMLDVIRRDIAVCTLMFVGGSPYEDRLREHVSKYYRYLQTEYLLALAYKIRTLDEEYKRANQDRWNCGTEAFKEVSSAGSYRVDNSVKKVTLRDACNVIIHDGTNIPAGKNVDSYIGHAYDHSSSIYHVHTPLKRDHPLSKDGNKHFVCVTKINLAIFLQSCLEFLDEVEEPSKKKVKGASSLVGAGQRPVKKTKAHQTTPTA